MIWMKDNKQCKKRIIDVEEPDAHDENIVGHTGPFFSSKNQSNLYLLKDKPRNGVPLK